MLSFITREALEGRRFSAVKIVCKAEFEAAATENILISTSRATVLYAFTSTIFILGGRSFIIAVGIYSP